MLIQNKRGAVILQNRIFCRSISLAMCIVLLICFTFSFISYASDEDYSYPAAPSKTTVYADDFLESELGVVLSDAEKKYLELQSGFVFSYNSNIPTSYITVEYNETKKEASVTVADYVYLAENGTNVIWKPISVTVGGETKNITAGNYTVKFTGVESGSADVKYTAEFTVTKESINRLLNLAYNDAPSLKTMIAEKKQEYTKLHSEYLENCTKYEKYLAALAEYESLYAVYSEYLSQKRIYDEKNSEYLKYLSDYSDYENAKKKYNEYLIAREQYDIDYAKYLEYLEYASQHQSKIDAYEAYLKKINTVKLQLNVINKTKTPVTELKRTIYDAIMGDTVTSVVANKALIANELVGVSGETVDRAGVATENLRALFEDYFTLFSEEQKYNYYITNYESFKNNFAELFRTLDKLYQNDKVRGVLVEQDKQQKYIILLSQLYYISHALTDGRVAKYDGGYYDSSYSIFVGYDKGGKKVETTPLKTIGNNLYIPDYDNATPLADGYPSPVEKPEYTEMQEPTMPPRVQLPIEPDPVSKPTPPKTVKKPTEPAVVNKPGKEPMPYVVPDEVQAVIDAYDSGKLKAREEYNGTDVKLSPEIVVSKKIVDPESVTVVFYDKEFNSTLVQNELYRISVDKGTYADYLGKYPEKLEDSDYIYTFVGWTDKNGNAVNFDAIDTDLSVYPKFDAEEKEYEVKWVVEGKELYENPGTPQKEPFGNLCYVFTHWEKSIDGVTSDVTYTACFEERFMVPLSNGGADVSFVDGNYVVETTSSSSKFDISMLVEYAAKNGGIIMKTARGQVSFSYTETIELKKANAHTIEIVVRQRETGGYRYAVNIYKADESEIQYSSRANVKFACDIDDITHLVLYYEENGEKKLIRNSADGKNISFAANTGMLYSANIEYTLNPILHDGVTITVDKASAALNEKVSVTFTAEPGVKVHKIYYIDEDNVKKEIVDGKFNMPDSNLRIGAEYTVGIYTVIFVSDGKTLATFECKYGDTVTPPENPKKAQDSKYSYTFTGWSPEILPVTEDAVYTAVYSSTPVVNNKGETPIPPSVLKIIVLGASLAGTVAVIVLPSSIMSIVLFVKRKKKLLKVKEK